jgi:L,D-peptidoglycan transpeptidase YkuD (ErfK/YbiS/YcfS/YnhG family)
MNIIIKNHLLLYRGYKIKCSIGKKGTKNIKKEGDLSTPRGIFKLGTLYFRKDRIQLPKCKIAKKAISKNMGWCDDIRCKKYNRLIYLPSKYRHEQLYRKSNIYDILINIKYNYTVVKKNKGSAIFIHLSDEKYKPTKGCIGIQKKDFLRIIPLLSKKTKILIM